MTPTRDRATESLAGALKVGLGIVAVLALGFVAYFILPKVEVHYRSTGVKPPFGLDFVFAISHFCVNYFWLIAGLGGLMVLFARNPAPRGDRSTS